VLTLGTNPSEDGIHVKALNSTTPFVVHGSIVSNSNIVVTNGSLQSNAGVYAHTGCTGTIVSTPAASCSAGTAADPGYQFEPAYGSPANAVPPYQAVPAATSANCPGKVMTFEPGYYDDAAALSNLMAGTGSNPCKGSVWWFKPASTTSTSTTPRTRCCQAPTRGRSTTASSLPELRSSAADNVLAQTAAPGNGPRCVPEPDQVDVGGRGAVHLRRRQPAAGHPEPQMPRSARPYRSPAKPARRLPSTASRLARKPRRRSRPSAPTSATGTLFAPPAGKTLAEGAAASGDGLVDTWAQDHGQQPDGHPVAVDVRARDGRPSRLDPDVGEAALRLRRVRRGHLPAGRSSHAVRCRCSRRSPGSLSSASHAAGATQLVDLLDTSVTGLSAWIHSNGFPDCPRRTRRRRPGRSPSGSTPCCWT